MERKQQTTPGDQRRAYEFAVMEATLMKAFGVISTTALLLLLGATLPAFAQEEHHEQEAKQPEKQEQAKPAKQEEKAKPAKQEEQAKPAKEEKQAQAKPEKQEQAKPAKQEEQAKPAKEEKQAQAKPEKQEHVQQVKGQQPEQAQGQWARNGQKDSRGHEYNESKFGRDHHIRFEATGGRMYEGHREYSYGGYWFSAGAYPAWFYQQDVYFIMGADGLWYAVAYNDPSLMFQVNIS